MYNRANYSIDAIKARQVTSVLGVEQILYSGASLVDPPGRWFANGWNGVKLSEMLKVNGLQNRLQPN